MYLLSDHNMIKANLQYNLLYLITYLIISQLAYIYIHYTFDYVSLISGFGEVNL